MNNKTRVSEEKAQQCEAAVAQANSHLRSYSSKMKSLVQVFRLLED